MSPPGAPPGLSVVVPAFNEESRLPETLSRLAAYLEKRPGGGEVLVVDDGSSDRTAEIAETWAATATVPVSVLRNPGNLGKGASVRRGVEAARGALILFTDADLSTPIEEADRLIEAIAGGCDVVIGSRAVGDSRVEVHQPWYREAMGKAFNRLARFVTGVPFHDTQCGFKAFRAEAARALFREQTVPRFGFDVEVLVRALSAGMRVREVGVVWRNSPASRVSPLRDAARMALDLVVIRWRLR